MDSSVSGATRLALAITWRAALVAILLFVVVELLWTTHLYATTALAAAMAAAVVVNLSGVISTAARVTETELARLVGEEGDLALTRTISVTRSPWPMARASAALSAARAQRHQLLELRQTLLDTVAAALIIVRPDGHVTLANRAARNLARIPVSRLDEIACIGAGSARRMLSLSPGAREIVRFTDGQRMYVSVSGFTAPDHELRRLLALQRVAGELDTVELEAWQDMAHVLAHEIMNSLTPISSLSESLEMLLHDAQDARGERRIPIDKEIATAIEIIKRRSRGLMDFVARYHAVAALPTPRQQRLQAAQFLQGIEVLLAPEFIQKGISYGILTNPRELCFSADAHLLEQAVINLMRNAADSVVNIQDAQIRLSCQLRDDWLAIEVQDNGCGVPDGIRDQIFVPFFTTKTAGSGIGLNVARQVALSHRGRIELRRNEPRGSIFTLLLPCAGTADTISAGGV
jgi:two-component system nitrogen regulation sensor histidine kinase NtrY